MNKKNLIYVLAICVVIFIIIYFFVSQNDDNISEVITTNTNHNIEELDENFGQNFSIQKNDSGISVLTNHKYQYVIEAPKDWVINQDTSNSELIEMFNNEAMVNPSDDELNTGMNIEIAVDRNSFDTLEEYIKKANIYSDYNISNEKIIVDAMKAYEIYTDAVGNEITTFIEKGDHVYLIVGYFVGKEKEDEYLSQYREIRDTFFFIDDNISKTNFDYINGGAEGVLVLPGDNEEIVRSLSTI